MVDRISIGILLLLLLGSFTTKAQDSSVDLEIIGVDVEFYHFTHEDNNTVATIGLTLNSTNWTNETKTLVYPSSCQFDYLGRYVANDTMIGFAINEIDGCTFSEVHQDFPPGNNTFNFTKRFRFNNIQLTSPPDGFYIFVPFLRVRDTDFNYTITGFSMTLENGQSNYTYGLTWDDYNEILDTYRTTESSNSTSSNTTSSLVTPTLTTTQTPTTSSNNTFTSSLSTDTTFTSNTWIEPGTTGSSTETSDLHVIGLLSSLVTLSILQFKKRNFW